MDEGSSLSVTTPDSFFPYVDDCLFITNSLLYHF